MVDHAAFSRPGVASKLAPDTYAAFVQAATFKGTRAARFGQGTGGGFDWLDLGRYMDEVHSQVAEFDTWITETIQNSASDDRLSHGLWGTWVSFVYADPQTQDTRGRPLGWNAYYRDYRGLVVPDVAWNWLFGDQSLWAITEQFEDHMISLYDWAVEEGGKPPLKRPTRKYQPPPKSETIEGKVEGALKWVGIIGLLAAGGYLLHSLPIKGGR